LPGDERRARGGVGRKAAAPGKSKIKEQDQMSLKKLGVALLTVFALGAFMASSAFAANEFVTTQGYWYTGASPGTKLGFGAANAKTLLVKALGEKQTLTTTVAGTPLDITAKKVSCVGCVIDNTTAAESGNAKDTATLMGKLKFEEVSVSEPAGCSTTTTIETKELTAELGMNAAGTKTTLEFFPTLGKTTSFALVELSGSGCAISGTYKVTGTVYGESVNATNVFAKGQKVKVSKAIQESAGTATSLSFGTNPAILTGELEGTLESGAEWAGKES
jgi:hypothetical protein